MTVKPPNGVARDWINALVWMRENLPPSPSKPGEPGTVVASWWDYGYWITAIANKTSLADNGTWNWTQVQQIGLMFMSNETEALKILRKYNVTHVVVFTTFNTNGQIVMAGGDEGKWVWMARIPGLDEKVFGNYTLGLDYVDADGNKQPTFYPYGSDYTVANQKGQDTVLYKLMTYGREMTVKGYSNVELQYFEEAYFSQKTGSPTPAPGTSYIPLVCVYKVNYPP
jgi:dolichyl-diphosphooligosaccharide--protein glycosyltransferase